MAFAVLVIHGDGVESLFLSFLAKLVLPFVFIIAAFAFGFALAVFGACACTFYFLCCSFCCCYYYYLLCYCPYIGTKEEDVIGGGAGDEVRVRSCNAGLLTEVRVETCGNSLESARSRCTCV